MCNVSIEEVNKKYCEGTTFKRTLEGCEAVQCRSMRPDAVVDAEGDEEEGISRQDLLTRMSWTLANANSVEGEEEQTKLNKKTPFRICKRHAKEIPFKYLQEFVNDIKLNLSEAQNIREFLETFEIGHLPADLNAYLDELQYMDTTIYFNAREDLLYQLENIGAQQELNGSNGFEKLKSFLQGEYGKGGREE